MREEPKERALLLGVKLNDGEDFVRSMEELANLAVACDMEVEGQITQNMERPHSALYMGKGKLSEVKAYLEQHPVDVVIFDRSLSPSQLRNLEQILDCAILDRTSLILEIFAERARTREARLQVESARLQYVLPRLTGMHKALSRQGGGSGVSNKVDVKDRGGVQDLPSIHGKIEFRNLTFRYPDGEYDVLKNVSFTIEPGESVGIVGKTGSGKTTIVDLLLRTYNVPDGTLFIDDHDVNTVSIHSVREGCAYVPQDNFLFSDTISGNISFAFDDENQEAIEDAAMMSDVHDNIAEFKEGYRTVLGERGVTVSGGQKQRISIARALMKHAPILILDDSVSAVDTKTERTILDNLKKREGLTTILIAHRISTVEQMDKIVFVEDGEVHAVGKHEDLYRTCTAYRKMVDLQKLEEEAGEE